MHCSCVFRGPQRWLSSMRVLVLVAAALGSAPSAFAQSADEPVAVEQPNQLVVRSAAAAPSSSQAPGAVNIASPQAGQILPPGRVNSAGRIGLGSGDRVRVIYVVDVSGSTSSIVPSPAPGRVAGDCNGDGARTSADDFNANSVNGEVLDCEIAGIVALNSNLRARTDVDVAFVGFGNNAAPADVAPSAGDSALTTPGTSTQGAGNPTADVETVARSLTSGTIGQFTRKNVGGGTNFDAPLREVAGLVAPQGPTLVFFLSDGEANVSGTTTGPLAQVVNKGAVVNTYAIGSGTGSNACASGAALGTIATSSQGTCTTVADPGGLAASLPGNAGQLNVAATLESRTSAVRFGPIPVTLSALNDFSFGFDNVAVGDWRIRVVATDAAGAQSTGSVEFSVADGATTTSTTTPPTSVAGAGAIPEGVVIAVDPPPAILASVVTVTTIASTIPPPPATTSASSSAVAPLVSPTTLAPPTIGPLTTVAAAVNGIQVEREVAFTGAPDERGVIGVAFPLVGLGALFMLLSRLRRRAPRQ